MEKINVAELLRNCPKGMELDCTMFDDVKFIDVDEADKPICIGTGDKYRYLTKFGTWTFDEYAKCVIFPKGKTTWEGFHRPFKDGDILAYNSAVGTTIFIHRNKNGEHTYKTSFYAGLNGRDKLLVYDKYHLIALNGDCDTRLATEEEKARLFQAIKDNGYKWNEETKTLEKLVGLKFKIGDRIKSVISSAYYTVVDIKNNNYFIKSDTEKYPYQVSFENGINYKLVHNKFDINTLVPFESRVLVRHNRDNKWCGSFFSHIDKDFHSHCYKFVTTSGKSYPMCIPYEGNEHLLGKTGDCDKFYKTWG